MIIDTLKRELQWIIDNIDAGNSNMSEEDMLNTIRALKHYSHKDEYMTKYEACQFLNGISRATFDNLVAERKLPPGEKKYAGDSNLFWKTTDLMQYKNNKK